MQTLKLIVNPASGGKRADQWVPQIEASLRQLDIDVSVCYTTKVGDGTDLAAAAIRDGYQRFGIVGGDGTISEVVNGLVQASTPNEPIGSLAIFPAGSGNDLAATLNLTADPQQFARAIAQESTRTIDICAVAVKKKNGTSQRFFINNLGVGLEAAVTQRYEHVNWVQGHLRYVVAALQTIFTYQSTDISSTWNRVETLQLSTERANLEWPDYLNHETTSQSGKTLLITIGNNRRAGGGFYLTPDAKLDDQLIDIGILRHVSKGRLVKLLGQALQGNHTHDPALTMVRTPEITIQSSEPLPVQADGELIALDAIEIAVTVHPQQLQLYV